ncbi:NADH-quinone oxidoreductase subunit C [Embleya hyalina]|uniref:Dehydrogenase n=1 Tax=Embleya hyalina TaxID=516124 RepID=A0A401YH98_9ACTN|nr:NADH-quinone oxidoreductase subunit C [Embleya hyalina]GCD93963.1 dehydrogenase [Embleya hyalina]
MTPEEIRAGVGEELVLAVSDAYGLVTLDVAPEHWVDALTAARDRLGCAFFDWLTGVDELADGFGVVAHVCAIPRGPRLLLRTRVPREGAVLASASGVYAGARWHERETHEMFGIDFTGHPGLDPLLLPDGFEGHPLRKEFVLAARVAKPWPGAKEPGESDHGGGPGRSPGRRRTLPPGVPDPATWGPHREEAAAEAAAAAEERPRRGASAGSAGRAGTEATEGAGAPPRRTRSASAGSASQAAEGAPPARRTRSASQGSASQPPPTARPAPAPPAAPAEPAEPAGPTTPAPPPEPTETGPTKPAEPAGPTAPASPPGPTETGPTKPAGPAEPAEPAGPTETGPAGPAETTESAEGDTP